MHFPALARWEMDGRCLGVSWDVGSAFFVSCLNSMGSLIKVTRVVFKHFPLTHCQSNEVLCIKQPLGGRYVSEYDEWADSQQTVAL